MSSSVKRIVLTFVTGMAFLLIMIGFFTPVIHGEATITVSSGWWIWTSTTTYEVQVSGSAYELALGQAQAEASVSGTTQFSLIGELSGSYPLFWLVLVFAICMLACSILSKRVLSIIFAILAVVIGVVSMAWALTDEVFSELANEGLQMGPGVGFVLIASGTVLAIISEGLMHYFEREEQKGLPAAPPGPMPSATEIGPPEYSPGYGPASQAPQPIPTAPPYPSSEPPPPPEPSAQQPMVPPPITSAEFQKEREYYCTACGKASKTQFCGHCGQKLYE